MYDRGGSFTKKKIGAVICKDPKASRKDIEEVLFDSDYRDIIEFEDELGLKEIREKYSSVKEDANELPPATIPAAINAKLQLAIDKIKDSKLTNNAKLQLLAQVIDAIGIDKSQLSTIASKIRSKMESVVTEEFKHVIHVDTPTQVVSKPVAAQIMALAKKGVRANEIGLEMGFVGNQKLATDAFQKVKNQIYFALDKRNESYPGFTDKKIDAKIIADRMRKHTDTKGFADKIAKMGKVSQQDLDKILPDYITGGTIEKLFKESVNEGKLADTWQKNNKKGYILKAGNIQLKSEGPSKTHTIYKNGYVWGKFHMDYESGGTDWWVEPSKGNDFYVDTIDDIVKRVEADSRFNESVTEEHDCGCNENHDCGCGGLHEHHINEDLSADANGIAGLTASRANAVKDFIEKNNINSNKLYLSLKKGNLKDRMDFVTALVGKPGNPIQKKVIKQFTN